MLLIGKGIVLCLWVACGVSLFFPTEGAAVMALRYGTLAVLLIHLVEMFAFRKEILAKSSNPVQGFGLVLLFGAIQMADWRSAKPNTTA